MELRERARAWLAQDPDPGTRAELAALLEAGDDAELADRFGTRLEFGTAGLRGRLGAGPNRMNRVTVMRAAAGVARWLGPGRTVVIGYDARHNSEVFARDTAAVLGGAGCTALLLPRALPTPVLAHAVRDLGADAGVMVTASHNPPQDNGYKVYVGGRDADGGSQIVPPMDTAISAAIDLVGPIDTLPLGGEPVVLGEEVVERYLAAVTALALGPDRDVAVSYTPLHGVGAGTLLAAFERAGFPAPSVVAEQAEPDPDFPTVAFPNPEEPGAMDLALAAGGRDGSDLVLANDPDADRLAVAVPGHGLLTGDEVGGLLAEHVLRHTSGDGRIVASTIVSAGLLPKIAAAHGVRHVETLTGFKWLVRAGGAAGRNVFSYEEALGYCIGGDGGRPVADKDGISAALAVAALAAGARREGRTLVDLLDDQAHRYGLHATRQLSVRVADLSRIGAVMRRLRAEPPAAFGELAVDSVEDFAGGLRELPPTDALRFHLRGPVEARVTLRPSGTEPKLKSYLEVVLPAGSDVAAARRSAAGYLDDLRAAVSDVIAAD
ncbi:phosphomannomutase [Marinitenerispora sediminis]|uniref:Phosphomannomutase n=1 Tax=Marinitenerispora sediminis TaxID=1931232 RepID=A0A368SZT1_9ACTN|nr:phosphomannomutase [Marinitenerispora sediminis]RCV51432.1 phosphomannomutase [Marinitenerispora sediminis]RCV57706.1 phosphomannomutase [Marinitenerispora sediminis]